MKLTTKMMKNNVILTICCCIFAVNVFAENDSVISRNVSVEREFQPVIKSAGKINVKPEVYEPTYILQDAQYSDYSNPLTTDFNMTTLGYSETNFTRPRPMNGFLRGGFGHIMTQADFHYKMQEKRNTAFDIDVNHLGQWGLKTLVDSRFGFGFAKNFQVLQLYFGAEGSNKYYTRYGKYYTGDNSKAYDVRFKDLNAPDDKQSLWKASAKLGIASLNDKETKYMIEAGYAAFIVPNMAVEHQVNTKGMFDWATDAHHVGLNFRMQNNIYHIEDNICATMDTAVYKQGMEKDFIHIAPYYAYHGKRVRLHAGINLDIMLGKGDTILPSPDVRFEADLTKDWLTLFAEATGYRSSGSLEGYLNQNRYLDIIPGITSMHTSPYCPINAVVGFHIRPHKDLLIDIHAGYNLTKNDAVWRAGNVGKGYFDWGYCDTKHWTIGGKLNYHYQDIVNVSLSGDYYVWTIGDIDFYDMLKTNSTVYDRPKWDLRLRVDGRIDAKWTIYSDNYFAGKRLALVQTEGVFKDEELRPTIDLNLGVQYNINKWLACYLQLNNYLGFGKLKYEAFYGYESQGINFLAGVSWAF